MIEKPFIELFPKPLPRDGETLFRQWVEAHQDTFDSRAQTMEEVAMTTQIREATGKNLDRIGEQFGQIGRRRGRGDEEYRAFLLSIVPSFRGRGTPTGLAFAIGAGVQARGDEIEITEHFDALEYSVTVGDWIRHKVSTIHDLADLADPSGVKMRTPVRYSYDSSGIGISFGEIERETRVGAPPSGVGIKAHDTSVSVRGIGFGGGRFDGEDEFGEASPLDAEREDSYGGSSYGDSSYSSRDD